MSRCWSSVWMPTATGRCEAAKGGCSDVFPQDKLPSITRETSGGSVRPFRSRRPRAILAGLRGVSAWRACRGATDLPAMRDMGHRLCGLAMLSAAGVTTMIHRTVYDVSHDGPATLSEFALGLATFVLGCLGLLLVIHGRALFRRGDRSTGLAGRAPYRSFRSRLVAPITPAGRAYDARYGALVMKTRHAAALGQASAGRHAVGAGRPDHQSPVTIRPRR